MEVKKNIISLSRNGNRVLWSNNSSTFITITILAYELGKITVEMTNCTTTFSRTTSSMITHDVSHLGMKEGLNEVAEIKYFPNPSKGNFKLNAIGLKSTVPNKITDMSGKLIHSYQWKNGATLQNVDLELVDVQSEMYMLILEEERGRAVHRINIER